MSAAATTEVAREEPPTDEIRVMNKGHVATYVNYAHKLFKEQNKDKITVRASGSAIPIAISTIEILKLRIEGLHQELTVGRSQLTQEVSVPAAEGAGQPGTDQPVAMETQIRTRAVPFLRAVLSKDVSAVDVNAPGYEKPVDPSLVREFKDMRPGTGGGGGVGSRGPALAAGTEGGDFGSRPPRRGRGRGRGGAPRGGGARGGPEGGPRGGYSARPDSPAQ